MAYTLPIPYYAFKIRFASGGHILVPMMYLQTVLADASVSSAAYAFKNAFQKKVIEENEYLAILEQYPKNEIEKSEVTVHFPKAKERWVHLEFELDFIYYHTATDYGTWAVVPVLGVETFIEKGKEIEEEVEKSIQLEFIRSERFKLVQFIIETMWFKEVELEKEDISLEFYSLAEQDKAKESASEEILPLVAKKLEVYKPELFGMEKEWEQAVRALQGNYTKNILLVGAAGVGKTALVWELARRKNRYGFSFEIWETTASTMIKELTGDVGWQENIDRLAKDLTVRGDVLYVRNLMDLFEVGQYEGNSVSMGEYLKSYLSNGQITLITECTDEELAQIDLKSANYSSLFQVIRMEEPEATLESIILKKMQHIAKANQVLIAEDAVKETLRLNKRFTPYAGFPGKPIRFLENIILNYKKEKGQQSDIHSSEVISYFCEETGMPPFMVDPMIPMSPKKIKTEFKQNLFGQDTAVDAVVDVFAAVKTALTRQGKPIASFLFVGPTGVGKTEMAKIMANFMFGSREKFVRFDMSEFSDAYAVLRLTGTQYGADGLLTAAVRKNPFGVVLFDEIEKAHPSFYDLLLQVLGEGRLSDTRGKSVNFCSSIIIMTSNIGASNLQHQKIGWTKGVNTADVQAHFMTEVEKHFRPELFNRIDKVIAFSPLSKDTMRFVVEREMELFQKREGIQFRNLSLKIEDEVLEYLTEKGYDVNYGARYLQRAMREQFIIPLARKLNQHEATERLEIEVQMNADDTAIVFQVKKDEMEFASMLERLSQYNASDLASYHRRKVHELMGGNLYVQMLSQLDMLEREKKRKKEGFWDAKEKSAAYTRLLELEEISSKIQEEIEKKEQELALAVMGLSPFPTEAKQEIKEWEQQFGILQLDLLTHLHPEYNSCTIAILGVEPGDILEFYQAIIHAKGWEMSDVKGIWFRESHYSKTKVKNEKANKAYIHRPINLTTENGWNPERKNDLLCGVQFTVHGAAAFLYFKNENGWMEWRHSSNHAIQNMVIVENKEIHLPHNIHRKDFVTKKQSAKRRVITTGSVQDNRYKIHQNFDKNNPLNSIIRDYLDEQFKAVLEEIIYKVREEA